MDSSTSVMRFYIFLAIWSLPFIVFIMLVIHATILYLAIPNSRSRPLIHNIWMFASEATKAIMEYIMEIADLLTLYTYALVISNTNMDSFKYFESVLGLQLVFMLNEFMLNGLDWDLKSIARLLVVFKYADYCPKIMEVMQVAESIFPYTCITILLILALHDILVMFMFGDYILTSSLP
ncbi:UNVERIFIED_CONTAM: hypothetical protein NCL1_17152 [Trichonephila clavipes]